MYVDGIVGCSLVWLVGMLVEMSLCRMMLCSLCRMMLMIEIRMIGVALGVLVMMGSVAVRMMTMVLVMVLVMTLVATL